jgi:uncharacterized repeat protein (TIGR03803 family)
MYKTLHFVSVLMLFILSWRASGSAQTVSTLFAFTGNNSSGGPLNVTPVQGRDGNLYGTTSGAGFITSNGSIFRIFTDGSGGPLYEFNGTAEYSPNSGVTLATDGNFYGAVYGGNLGLGVLYRITPLGEYTVVYNFQGLGDGSYPEYPPVQASDGSLYGVAQGTYTPGTETIYKYSAAGAVTTIFTLATDGSQGSFWSGALIQAADSNLYATTYYGGTYGCGTILKVSTAGEVLRQYSFRCTQYGAYPSGPLLEASDGNFYGTTNQGGINLKNCAEGCGTFFRMTETGQVTVLTNFGLGPNLYGELPNGGLVEGTDGNLYGTTRTGAYGVNYGTIFQTTTSGVATDIYVFRFSDREGWEPSASLMQHTNGTFYSTNFSGGVHQEGTVYSLDMGLGPFIAFVLPTGKVGQSAQILGQGLTGASAVSFNGLAAASFHVDSDTSMTAVVPAGATTGPVVVTTSTGTLTSNQSFRVSN